MSPTFLLALALLPGAPSDDIYLTAAIDAESLEVGAKYEIFFEFEFAEGLSAGEAGIPAPFLQIDVPDSIELTGRVLSTHRELSRNEFIQEPYERLVKETPTTIGFEILREPDPDERIGLNVTGYVRSSDGERTFFVRRRLELPIAPRAVAVDADPKNSDWGADDALLQIGDEAASFTLPRADASTLDPADVLGKKNVIVTTYRAYW